METFRRELLVARIVAGQLRCRLDDDYVVIKQPSLEQTYLAQELFQETYSASEEAGLYSENELLEWLEEEEFWLPEQEEMLTTCGKNIEQLKVQLYNNLFKSIERELARKTLKKTRELQRKLLAEKAAYGHLSCLGFASLVRSQYLIGMSVYRIDGTSYYTTETFWNDSSAAFDRILQFYYASRIVEGEFRELARSDPWRSIWNTRKSEGATFGIPSVSLSDEQRTLTVWSSIYDSIYEHPECPPESVIIDDDVLDGWMIIQKRKREDKMGPNADSLISNEKIRNSGEVFLPADTMADAKEIDKLNDTHARIVKRKRLAKLRREGEVLEANMPDSMEKIQQELGRQYAERGKHA